MELQNSFTVSADPATVGAQLLDVEQLVPCMPGAELVETIDDTHWRGRLKIKFGPVALAFNGDVQLVERDDEVRRLRLTGAGKDKGGRGSASADVVVRVLPAADAVSTTVDIVQDLKVAGQIASFGRGMIADVSKSMTKQFADRLEVRLAAGPGIGAAPGEAVAEAASAAGAAPAVTTAVRPAPLNTQAEDAGLSGFRIIWVVLTGLVRRLVRRLGRRLTGRRKGED